MRCRPPGGLLATVAGALGLAGLLVLSLATETPRRPHPAVACTAEPAPRDIIGLMRRAPHVAVVKAGPIGPQDGYGWEAVRLDVEKWIANPVDRFTVHTRQDTGNVIVSSCSGASPYFEPGLRHVVFFDESLEPGFEGVYEISTTGLRGDGLFGAPRDLVGLPEFAASQRIDAAGRFLRGEGMTYYGRGPAEELLWFPISNHARDDGRPRLGGLVGESPLVFVGTVLSTRLDEAHDGVPATRVTFRVDRMIRDRNNEQPGQLDVLQYGAIVGRWRIEAEGERIMQPGEQYLVFRWRGEAPETPGLRLYRVFDEHVYAVSQHWLSIEAAAELDGLPLDEVAARVEAIAAQ